MSIINVPLHFFSHLYAHKTLDIVQTITYVQAMTEWITRKEAVRLANVTHTTLNTWRKAGKVLYKESPSPYKYKYKMYLYCKDSVEKVTVYKNRYTLHYIGEHACSEHPIEILQQMGSDDGHGYKLTGCRGHPYANTAWKVYVHRLVMEKHLGRYLDPKETVHHIDGDRSNNDITNLVLFNSRGEHLKHVHQLEMRFRSLISTPQKREYMNKVIAEAEAFLKTSQHIEE